MFEYHSMIMRNAFLTYISHRTCSTKYCLDAAFERTIKQYVSP